LREISDVDIESRLNEFVQLVNFDISVG
jgi:hypothetical protein